MSTKNKETKKTYNKQARLRTVHKLAHQVEANHRNTESQVSTPKTQTFSVRANKAESSGNRAKKGNTPKKPKPESQKGEFSGRSRMKG